MAKKQKMSAEEQIQQVSQGDQQGGGMGLMNAAMMAMMAGSMAMPWIKTLKGKMKGGIGPVAEIEKELFQAAEGYAARPVESQTLLQTLEKNPSWERAPKHIKEHFIAADREAAAAAAGAKAPVAPVGKTPPSEGTPSEVKKGVKGRAKGLRLGAKSRAATGKPSPFRETVMGRLAPKNPALRKDTLSSRFTAGSPLSKSQLVDAKYADRLKAWINQSGGAKGKAQLTAITEKLAAGPAGIAKLTSLERNLLVRAHNHVQAGSQVGRDGKLISPEMQKMQAGGRLETVRRGRTAMRAAAEKRAGQAKKLLEKRAASKAAAGKEAEMQKLLRRKAARNSSRVAAAKRQLITPGSVAKGIGGKVAGLRGKAAAFNKLPLGQQAMKAAPAGMAGFALYHLASKMMDQRNAGKQIEAQMAAETAHAGAQRAGAPSANDLVTQALLGNMQAVQQARTMALSGGQMPPDMAGGGMDPAMLMQLLQGAQQSAGPQPLTARTSSEMVFPSG